MYLVLSTLTSNAISLLGITKASFLYPRSMYTSYGLGSAVCIATGYGLDGPGIESQWGRDFPHLSRPVLGPTQPPIKWYRVFPEDKERPGREADPSPLLVPWSRKSAAIPSHPPPPPWAVRTIQSPRACTRTNVCPVY